MSTRDDIKEEIKKEDELMGSGEGTVGSGSTDPDTANDVDENFSEAVGHEPHGADNLADEVEAAEEAEHGEEPHEDKREE